MKQKEILIIVIAILIAACIIAVAVFVSTDNLNSSDIQNNTTNLKNNTTANDTVNLDDNSEKSYSNSAKSSDNNVVSENVEFNAQQGEGYYKEVKYADGGFRQYDTDSGELIGSSYDSDQGYLESKYGTRD